jgi:aminoglycoside phosphotransferase (APT) family kinase protein
MWYERETDLQGQAWLGPTMSAEQMARMSPLWEALALHALDEFPESFTRADLARSRSYISSLRAWWHELEHLPRTLVHNDFNPRNITLRKEANGGGLRLCAYDWELATLGTPTHDLAELLTFVLTHQAEQDEVDHYVRFHREALEAEIGRPIEEAAWRLGYALSLRDLWVNRFALYLMAHSFRHYGFLERSLRTLRHLLVLEEGQTFSD